MTPASRGSSIRVRWPVERALKSKGGLYQVIIRGQTKLGLESQVAGLTPIPYDYDHLGRLIEARTGSEARGMLIGQGGTQDGPYAHSYRYEQWGNMWYRVGWGGSFNPWLEQWPSYANNRLLTNLWTGATMQYDARGNLTSDGYQSYTYDATGQQTYASATALSQSYDGDGLRVKKTDSGVTTYYLRSPVLGGQVVCELDGLDGPLALLSSWFYCHCARQISQLAAP